MGVLFMGNENRRSISQLHMLTIVICSSMPAVNGSHLQSSVLFEFLQTKLKSYITCSRFNVGVTLYRLSHKSGVIKIKKKLSEGVGGGLQV
jgi:hypothetical protein